MAFGKACVAAAVLAGLGATAEAKPLFAWVYQFDPASGVAGPSGGLVFDGKGSLWGVGNNVSGTVSLVFNVTKQGKLLHVVQDDCVTFKPIGCELNGNLAEDPSGAVYGTALVGPQDAKGRYRSTLFRIRPSGSASTFALFDPVQVGEIDGAWPTYYAGGIYTLTGNNGPSRVVRVDLTTKQQTVTDGPSDGLGQSLAAVAFDSAGNLWAPAPGDDTGGTGTFRIGDEYLTATATWTYPITYTPSTFCNTGAIGKPYIAPDGSVYVTTANNSLTSCDGATGGWVIKLAPGGRPTVLASFDAVTQGTPGGGVVGDGSGAVYGSTFSEAGTSAPQTAMVYCVTPAGRLVTLASFPFTQENGFGGELLPDGAGSLYGVTGQGGPLGYGGVYKITPGSACTP